MFQAKQFIITFLILPLSMIAWGQSNSNSGSGGKLENAVGSFALATDLVENGISQTNKNPAIIAGFNYSFGGTGKLGVTGSSVNFPGYGETVNVRPFLSYKFYAGAASDVTIRTDWNRYFQGGDHDGFLVGFAVNSLGYIFSYDLNTNWEATHSPSSHYHFSKDWPIPWNLIYMLRVGYNQVPAGFTNYFDIYTGIKYRFSDIDLMFNYTYNSSASQFDGRADTHYVIAIAMRY